MILYDRDNPTVYDYGLFKLEVETTIGRQYHGQTSMETSYFRFDFDPPYHCIYNVHSWWTTWFCQLTMLNVVPNISSKVI